MTSGSPHFYGGVIVGLDTESAFVQPDDHQESVYILPFAAVALSFDLNGRAALPNQKGFLKVGSEFYPTTFHRDATKGAQLNLHCDDGNCYVFDETTDELFAATSLALVRDSDLVELLLCSFPHPRTEFNSKLDTLVERLLRHSHKRTCIKYAKKKSTKQYYFLRALPLTHT